MTNPERSFSEPQETSPENQGASPLAALLQRAPGNVAREPGRQSSSGTATKWDGNCHGKVGAKFKGGVKDLENKVFETYKEKPNATQFQDTKAAIGVYVAVKLTNGADLQGLFEGQEHEIPSVEPPTRPDSTRPAKDSSDNDAIEEWKEYNAEFDEYLLRKKDLKRNI